MVERTTEKLIQWILNYSKTCVILCLVLFGALAPGLSFFKDDYDPLSWWDKGSPERVAFEGFESRFGDDGILIVALKNERGIFNPETVSIIKEMTEELQRLSNVLRVESLYNYNHVSAEEDSIAVNPFLEESATLKGDALQTYLAEKRQVALEHPFLPDLFIDREGKTTLLFAYLEPTFGKYVIYSDLVDQANEMVQRYREKNPHLAIYLGGPGMLDTTFQNLAKKEMQYILPGFLLIILLYLFFTFRSLVIPFFPFAIIIMTLMMTFGLGFLLGFPFSIIMQMLPLIAVAIAVADSVHILSYYCQCLGRGLEQREALVSSLRKNFLPSVLTTFSTFIGFFSFVLSDIVPIRIFGMLGGISCFFAWFLTIFMVCPILLWIKIKVPRHFLQNNQGKTTHNRSEVLAGWVKKYRKAVVLFFLFLTPVLGVLTFKNEADSSPFKNFRKWVPLRVTQDFFRDNFGNTSGPEVIIDSGKENGVKEPAFLAKVEQFKNWLMESPQVSKTIDVIDILKDMNQAMNGGREDFYTLPTEQKNIAELLFLYTLSLPEGMNLNNRMSLDNRYLRMSVFWDVETSKEWIEQSNIITEKARQWGLNVEVTREI